MPASIMVIPKEKKKEDGRKEEGRREEGRREEGGD